MSQNQVSIFSFNIDKQAGLLKEASYIESPNCDDRPLEDEIELVVIHGISLPPNEFGGSGVEQLFTNRLDPNEHPYYETIKDLKVSAHVFIRRNGEVIQFVPFHKKAWHAGLSEYKGREKCNEYSVGIELEGTDDVPYTESQYLALMGVLKALWQAYPQLQPENLVGHCDIAPGRKTDPGKSFDWAKLIAMLGMHKINRKQKV